MPSESQPPSPPPSDARPFRCQVDGEPGFACVRAIGELDLGTVPILRAEVDSLREAGLRRLILNLSRLDFIDSAGLGYILECDAQAREGGFSFALVRGPHAVQSVFELSGIRARLPFVDPKEDGAMDDEVQHRVAANEAALRKVNEAIERGQWPGEDGQPVGFRCECARLGCDQLIELTTAEYEQVRAHPRRFVIVQGHEVAAEDTVVVSGDGWVVVEKRDLAGAIAEATDPRE